MWRQDCINVDNCQLGVGCCKVRDIHDFQMHLSDFYARIRHDHVTPWCTGMLRAHLKLSKSLKTLVQHHYDSVENKIWGDFEHEFVSKPAQVPEQDCWISGSWRFWTEIPRKCVSSRSGKFWCQWRLWWVRIPSLIIENGSEPDISEGSMRMQSKNHGFGQNPPQPCNSLTISPSGNSSISRKWKRPTYQRVTIQFL